MNDSIDLFLYANEDDWIKILPKNQERQVKILLESNTPERVAEIWVDGKLKHNASYSTKPSKSYYRYISKEMEKLVCGDNKYEKERAEIENILKENKEPIKGLVYYVAGILVANISIDVTLILPVVALILMQISKVPINAWCEMKKEASLEK